LESTLKKRPFGTWLRWCSDSSNFGGCGTAETGRTGCAAITALHCFRHRQIRDFGLGITVTTLGLHLASVVPRVQFY
jgi:hypothetical protein